MKKLFFAVIFFAVTILAVQAQEKFEGSIIFDIKIESSDIDPQTAAMLPKEATMYMANNKVCTVQKTMFSEQRVIVDAEAKMLWILMSMMGQNMAIQSTFAEAMEDVDVDEVPEFEYLDEYKTIAGYKCQKVVSKDPKNSIVMYVTDAISGFENMYLDNPMYNTVKGFMLEVTSEEEGINMKMSAREVKKGAVEAAKFEVPAHYQKMSMKEFKAMMGE